MRQGQLFTEDQRRRIVRASFIDRVAQRLKSHCGCNAAEARWPLLTGTIRFAIIQG